MLTVRQAVEAPTGATVTVRGHVIATAGGTVLAEMLAESYPPQPGGATLPVQGVDVQALDGVEQAGDTTWTTDQHALTGQVRDGVLHVE